MEDSVSAYLVKLRRHHPFLATLSMYMKYQFSDGGPAFETDGEKAVINTDYFAQLSQTERLGTLLHVTLHAALMHPARQGQRDPVIWNMAADIVTNAVIADTRFDPPPGTAQEPRYRDLSVEQVYQKLMKSGQSLAASSKGKTGQQSPDQPSVSGPTPPPSPDEKLPQQLSTATSCETTVSAAQQILQTLYPLKRDLTPTSTDTPKTDEQNTRRQAYWKRAMQRARTVEQLHQKSQGDLPAGLALEINQVLNPQLDWRILLWRFVVKTPCDYAGFDRRFVHQGLYLDALHNDSLTVHIAMDTSGSIDTGQLAQFRAEVESIIRCYGHIDAKLYFVDTQVYGPYPLSPTTTIEKATGGGGTDFSDFFTQVACAPDPFAQAICVYLTDGFGTFPEVHPSIPVLWVVTADGSTDFPFGEVAYLN